MSTLVRLTCAGCGSDFDKELREVARQKKARSERRFFCSMRCYATTCGKVNLGTHLGSGRTEQLDAGNRQDQFSPFRYFMRKARNRRQATDLDLDYLKALWERQEGRCALSGIAMELPRNTRAWERRTHDPWKPSLDRIDSRRGYLKGNVRFVVVIANLAKGGFDDATLVEFCRSVVSMADGIESR